MLRGVVNLFFLQVLQAGACAILVLCTHACHRPSMYRPLNILPSTIDRFWKRQLCDYSCNHYSTSSKMSNRCQIHPNSIILDQIESQLTFFDANHETNSYSPSYKEFPMFLPSPYMVATNLRPLRKMLYKVHEGF